MDICVCDKKGVIVIPEKFRKMYNLLPGTKFLLTPESDGIKLIPVNKEFVQRNIGFLDSRVSLIDVLLEEKCRERF